MAQFQEEMRQQLEASMDKELENLLSMSEGADVEVGVAGRMFGEALFHKSWPFEQKHPCYQETKKRAIISYLNI